MGEFEWASALINSQPIAFKADVYTYTKLYKLGRVYFDSKLVCMIPLNELIPLHGGVLISDRWNIDPLNGFIALLPNNKLLKAALDQLVLHVNQKTCEPGDLGITGPKLFCDIKKN